MTKLKHFLKMTSVAAVTMVAVATFSQDASASTYPIRGDVNNDGSVNASDIVALKRYMAGYEDSCVTKESADLDRDSSVNDVDLTVLQKIIMGNDKAYFVVNGADKIFYENEIFLDNGKFFGIMQRDGNVVIYRRDNGKNVAIFSTGTHVEADKYRNHRIAFQKDGNIVVYADRKSDGKERIPRWSSKTCLGQESMNMAFLNNEGALEWTNVDISIWSSAPDFISKETDRARNRVINHYKYSDPQNAAMDFIYAYNRESIEACTEYGATIRKEDNYYILTETKISTDIRRDRGDGDGPELTFTEDDVAWVHTHGIDFCKNDENSRFSDHDLDMAEEMRWGEGSTAYLGAPNGEMWRYIPYVDKRSDKEFQSGRCIYSGWYKDPIKGAR